MMNGAGLTGNLRSGLWAECARTATKLDNLDCENEDKEPRYKRFFKKDFEGLDYLKSFGEVGIMTLREKMKAKIKNRGIPCLYLGSADSHGKDVNRLLKLATKNVVRSRDVKWLNKTLKEYLKDKGEFEDDLRDESVESNEGYEVDGVKLKITDDSSDDEENKEAKKLTLIK